MKIIPEILLFYRYLCSFIWHRVKRPNTLRSWPSPSWIWTEVLEICDRGEALEIGLWLSGGSRRPDGGRSMACRLMQTIISRPDIATEPVRVQFEGPRKQKQPTRNRNVTSLSVTSLVYLVPSRKPVSFVESEFNFFPPTFDSPLKVCRDERIKRHQKGFRPKLP